MFRGTIFLLLLLLPVSAWAQGSGDTDTASLLAAGPASPDADLALPSDLDLAIANGDSPASSLDILMPMTTRWNTVGRRWTRGNHEVTAVGVTSTSYDPFNPGGALPYDAFNASITYRYRGLFGGIIRPVARFSTGVGHGYAMPGVNSRGFVAGDAAFAMPEAGLEIVYKGYGVGMTAGYLWYATNWSQDDELTGYPFAPNSYPGSVNWGDLVKNIYLIAE